MKGTLIVKPTAGNFVSDGEWLGTADPYLEITLGGTKQKTSVSTDGGKTPTWNDTLTFKVNGEQSMSFLVMEYDNCSESEKLGEGVVNLNEVYQRGQLKNKYI